VEQLGNHAPPKLLACVPTPVGWYQRLQTQYLPLAPAWPTAQPNGDECRRSLTNSLVCDSDSVTRFNDSTRVTKRTMVSRLGQSHIFYRMTRLDTNHNQCIETRVRVIFTKSWNVWAANRVGLHWKKELFASMTHVWILPQNFNCEFVLSYI